MAPEAQAVVDDGQTDMDQVNKEYDKEQALRTMFRPSEPGVYLGRILPPQKSGLYYVQFGLHWQMENFSLRFADTHGVACLRETLKEDCPLCELQKMLYFQGKQEHDETKLNQAKEIRCKIRRVVNFVHMDNPGAGVLTWEFPANPYNPNRVPVATKIGSIFKEWGNVTHPETGHVLRLTFEKKGEFLNCEDVAYTSKQTPIPVPNWKDARHDLVGYARSRVIPADELRKILKEEAEAAQGGRRSNPARSASPAAPATPTGSDDPEVIPGDDDGEGENEAPTRKEQVVAEATQGSPLAVPAAKLDESDPRVAEILETLRRAGRMK